MDTPRPDHLRGADDVAPWVTGSQIARDLMARRHEPFNAPRQDDEDGNPFALLRELLDRMRAAEAQAGDASGAVAVNGATREAAYVVDDAYRNGGFGAVPASGDAIAGLQETSAGEARERACAVCMQDFEEGGDRLRRLPCSHSFHERCIFDWLRVSRVCPFCRHRLPMERE
ncbi:uncharacterized protein [Lolium perenne]|uniref:uncharacterized protein n=1 Tax=Lolium perenne TaxID=4522 RepID=UPI0021EA7352|nr:uncharacterized protein LOC127319709 [Lolium perenne]